MRRSSDPPLDINDWHAITRSTRRTIAVELFSRLTDSQQKNNRVNYTSSVRFYIQYYLLKMKMIVLKKSFILSNRKAVSYNSSL